MPAIAAAARAISLRGQRLWAKVRPRLRELVPLAAAVKARVARRLVQQGETRGAAAGKAAEEKAGVAGRGTQVVQAAAEPRRGREEKAAGSGRQTVTREGAAGGESEHEGGSRGNVSTIGEGGADARSAEGGASASTSGEGARARIAEGRASASTLG